MINYFTFYVVASGRDGAVEAWRAKKLSGRSVAGQASGAVMPRLSVSYKHELCSLFERAKDL